jgi:hypothetical protein
MWDGWETLGGTEMSSHISCYNMNRELEHFEVPEPVYVYIIQLENEIRYGSGGVKRLYPFRFGEEE